MVLSEWPWLLIRLEFSWVNFNPVRKMKRCIVTKISLSWYKTKSQDCDRGSSLFQNITQRRCFAIQKLKVHIFQFTILTQQTIRFPQTNYLFQNSDVIFITSRALFTFWPRFQNNGRGRKTQN